MYEHRKEPIASKAVFYRRIIVNIIVALLIMALFLLIGTVGYHYTADMIWIDVKYFPRFMLCSVVFYSSLILE